MARLLEDAHWLYEKDVSSVLFPRSYNLSREPKIFLEDFRLTAAAGLLKWFVEKMQDCCTDQSCCNLCGHRPILMNRLEFAMKRCEEFVACENHQNIDEDIVTEFTEEEWNSFLDDYMAAVHEGAGIEINEKYQDQIQVRPQKFFKRRPIFPLRCFRRSTWRWRARYWPKGRKSTRNTSSTG